MRRLSQIEMLRWLIWRDVTLAWRHRSEVLGSLVFFVIVVSLFPLGIGPDAELLRGIAPGVTWVAALLALVLALRRLFDEDYADGTLEQLLVSPQPVAAIALGKVIAQWLVAAIPVLVIAPLVGLQFGLSLQAPIVLAATVALGSAAVLLIGSVGAALTLGVRGAGTLTPLLVMPLYVPTLVFGAGTVQAVVWGGSALPGLRLLGAMTVAAVVLMPWATAAALRISLE
jgi:heme exporter protein B